MRSLAILAVFLPFMLSASAARAASKDAKERAAKKACLAGDTAKGVELLAGLYVDTNDPTFIFDQGRCFELAHRYEDALSRFREYLMKVVNPSDQDKADTDKHIAACQSYLAAQAAVAQPPAPAEAAKVPTPLAAPVATQPAPAPPMVVSASQSIPARDSGSGLRTAGIITASVGGAALLAGVELNLKVNSMTSDLEQPNNYNRSTDSTRKDYKTMAWIGYSVGAACVASGAVLYYLGWSRGHDSSATLALAPAVAPGTVGAVLAGGF
jgi:hypothetical protein